MNDLKYALSVLSLIGSALTAFKLLRTGLYKDYPVFFLYFVLRVPQGLLPLVLNIKSNAYFYSWAVTEPLTWILFILLVVELAGAVLSRYRGLYTVFSRAMAAAILISVMISVATLLPRLLPEMPVRSKVFGYIIAGERAINLSLALFILLILFVISRYPISLVRNLRVHAVVYTVYFLSNTVGFVMQAIFGVKVREEMNILLMVTSNAAMLAWFLMLKPEEEHAPVAPLRSVSRQQEQRLLTQLESLNSTLMKVSRQ